MFLQCQPESCLCSARYPTVYVFEYQNMRNDKFKELREELQETSRRDPGRGSCGVCLPVRAELAVPRRFCMGSTGVLQVALGRSAADEYGANLSELSRRIVGNVGLFFTKLPREEVRVPWFCNSSAL